MQKLRWSVKYPVTKGSFSCNPEQNCSFSFTTLRLSYNLVNITHFYFSTEADFFSLHHSFFLSSWQSSTTTLLCHRSSRLPQLCKLLTFRTVMFSRLYLRISNQLNNELNITFLVCVCACVCLCACVCWGLAPVISWAPDSHLLTAPSGMGERIRRVQWKKILGWDKGSLMGEATAVHASKANQGINLSLPMGRQGFSHCQYSQGSITQQRLGKKNTITLNVPSSFSSPNFVCWAWHYMEYPSGHLGSAHPNFLCPPSLFAGGMVWGAENALTLCKLCSAITGTPPYYQHRFQPKSKTQPHIVKKIISAKTSSCVKRRMGKFSNLSKAT